MPREELLKKLNKLKKMQEMQLLLKRRQEKPRLKRMNMHQERPRAMKK